MCIECLAKWKGGGKLNYVLAAIQEGFNRLTGFYEKQYRVYATFMNLPASVQEEIGREIQSLGKPNGWLSSRAGVRWFEQKLGRRV